VDTIASRLSRSHFALNKVMISLPRAAPALRADRGSTSGAH